MIGFIRLEWMAAFGALESPDIGCLKKLKDYLENFPN